MATSPPPFQSALLWIPVTYAGFDGWQTFVHIDSMVFRAVYVPMPNKQGTLYISSEKDVPMPSEEAVKSTQNHLDEMKEPIKITTEGKLIIRYIIGDYTDEALRLSIVLLKSLVMDEKLVQ